MSQPLTPDALESLLTDLPINIDGLDNEDLHSTIDALEYAQEQFKRLQTLCELQIQSRQKRLIGDIETALEWERKSERTYKRLNDFLKW